MKLSSAIANAVLAAFPVFAAAQDTPPPAASPTPAPAEPTAEAVTVRLKDGSLLRARIIDQDEQRVKVVTLGGLALEIPAAMVERIDRTGSGAEAPARPSDSNYTRRRGSSSRSASGSREESCTPRGARARTKPTSASSSAWPRSASPTRA